MRIPASKVKIRALWIITAVVMVAAGATMIYPAARANKV